jgi:hypothetical protein
LTVATAVLAALAAAPDPALDGALGVERAAALRAALAARAEAWAREVAAGGAVLGLTSADAAALAGALGEHDGPVVLVAPDVPHLDRALADAALADLEAGCVVALAPATDGNAFLHALARPAPELLALAFAQDRRRDDVIAAAVALGEVGLLRSERRLVSPADARALALDPLAPEELRRLAQVG